MSWQATKERAELGSKRCFYSMRIHEAVSATILGKNHSERVLNALRSAGVPEKYLFDPRRVEAAGKEAAA